MLDCVLLEIKVKSNKALANGRLNLCMLDAQLSISTSKPGIPFSGEPSIYNDRVSQIFSTPRWSLFIKPSADCSDVAFLVDCSC